MSAMTASSRSNSRTFPASRVVRPPTPASTATRSRRRSLLPRRWRGRTTSRRSAASLGSRSSSSRGLLDALPKICPNDQELFQTGLGRREGCVSVSERTPDIASGRLTPEEYAANFSDLHPPLEKHQAFVEDDRCYFCYDAPCVQACPTGIDIPMFIREILTDNPKAAAETILSANILGGMCARVCPTETLCEEACVREKAEGKPVRIGELQRYATDTLMTEGRQPFERAPATGKCVAVVGGGPAGLSCAHRLAMHGHDVVIYDAKPKLGGLNEYGIAAYKTVNGFANAEVDFILSIGGISIEAGKALGRDFTLADLRAKYDAVFVGL